MNEVQRSVIQRHYKQLADDIMMTEDLYGALFQSKIFERHMIDTIKAEKTPQEQVYKMLSMLTKRGPDAFDLFVEILKEDYPWLSAMLETSQKSIESLSRQNSMMTICTCGSAKMDNTPENAPIVKPATEVQTDGDIKTRVGQFIHKHFGHSKRISQTDKKTMERWFAEQLQQERKRTQKEFMTVSADDCIPETPTDTTPQPDPVQEKLNQVFNKVKDENLTGSKENSTKEPEDSFDELDGDGGEKLKTEDLTNMLDTEIDKLINKLNELDSQIMQCQYILGDHDNKFSLPDLVRDAAFMRRQYEQELAKEKAKSEKMVNEIYDYCKSISKLENTRKNLRQELDEKATEIKSLRCDNSVLREKCKILETEKMQHLEKEQTIENLRKVIQELKQPPKVDENANYRQTGVQRTIRRQNRALQGRRGSLDHGLSNGSSPFRKPVKPNVTMSRRRQIPKY